MANINILRERKMRHLEEVALKDETKNIYNRFREARYYKIQESGLEINLDEYLSFCQKFEEAKISSINPKTINFFAGLFESLNTCKNELSKLPQENSIIQPYIKAVEYQLELSRHARSCKQQIDKNIGLDNEEKQKGKQPLPFNSPRPNQLESQEK